SGRFLCLEFSSVDVPGVDALYELYSFQVIPRVGEIVTGDREAYQYLVESIRKFPKPKAYARMIETAGFRRVSFTPMTGGVVALQWGGRLRSPFFLPGPFWRAPASYPPGRAFLRWSPHARCRYPPKPASLLPV